MTKKHKFIDTLKSWLVTLGVASVFGLAALGVNATKTYQKASAYEYQDNGTLIFYVGDTNSPYDNILLINFFESIAPDNNEHDCLFDVSDATERGFECDYYAFGSHNGIKELAFYDAGDNHIISLFLSGTGVVSFEVDIDENGYRDPFYFTILPSYLFYQELRNYALSYNVPQSQGNFLTALTDFMQLLGGAIVQLAQPIANGVTEFARDLFIDNNHLSILGGVIGIFAGIALAVGITSKVYTWVTSLGN